MSKPIISVENLSKAYRLGLKEEAPETLVSAVAGALKAPLRNWRRLRRLDTSRRDGDDGDDILWALRDVSFEVQRGEVVGIIGRNGAGKSTLLKILSRITEPTSGRIVLRGRVSSLLEVGTGFHPELTGRDNIYMNGTILGMRKREIDRKFDEIVEFSGVEKFLDTPVKRYSSGMTVRLAFAVAAHLEPEILIVDEGLAVGDAEFQKKCLGKMQDVADGGRTVLFVSHNMAAVEALCTRGVELRSGALAMDGEVDEVLTHYRRSAYANVVAQTDDAIARSEFIESAQLLDADGHPTTVLPLGSRFRLETIIRTLRELPGHHISFGIDTIAGERMLSISMPSSEWTRLEANSQSRICCEINEFPLAPGEYSIKIAILDRGRLIETVAPVVPFSVIDAELFGTGQGFSRGRCIANASWSLTHSDR